MHRVRVPGWVVVVGGAMITALGLVYAVYEINYRIENPAAVVPAGTAATGPVTLTVGTIAPPFEAEGWINGPPPAPTARGPKLIVADIWALW